jgi:hypothetical protein
MSRVLQRPKDPETLGLAVLALRRYAQGTSPEVPFEAGIAAALEKLKVPREGAQRLVDNFDKIRPSVRGRWLGPLGLSTARIPQDVPRGGEPSSVRGQGAGLSGLLRRARKPTFPGDDQTLPLPGESGVPAATRYTILYQGMHCEDESGLDVAGSDETYIITSAVHPTREGLNVVTTVGHPFVEGGGISPYGNVDSYDTRPGPVASCWSVPVANLLSGVSLKTVVFDHDWGDPDRFRDEVDTVVKLALAYASYAFPLASPFFVILAADGSLTDFFNWLLHTGDSKIGTDITVLEIADLEDYGRWRQPSTTYAPGGGRVWFRDLPYHFLASVNDRDYFAAFTVVRDPPAPYPEPVVE